MIKKGFLFLLLNTIVFIASGCSDSDESPMSGDSAGGDSAGEDSSPPDDSEPADSAPPFSTDQLMTAQDALNSAYSNISITNAAGSEITASGLYIASFDINDCSACFGSVMVGDNVTGAFVQPVTFEVGQSIKIGQNYLYNLLYNGLYGLKQVISTPCQLPGCTWPGDDNSVAGWCLTIGVMSRNSSYTSSSYTNASNLPANVVPFLQAVTNVPFNYKYDLIDPNTFAIGEACLGPIVCSDQTLTCSVSTLQTQTFQSY